MKFDVRKEGKKKRVLEELSLTCLDNSTDKDLEIAIKLFPNLKILYLSSFSLTDQARESITNLSNTLEKLKLINCKFSDEIMPSIARLNKLKTLVLHGNDNLTDLVGESIAMLFDTLENLSLMGRTFDGNQTFTDKILLSFA